MNLSPAVRAAIGALIAAGTAALTVLADDAFTVEDAIIVALAFLGSFAIVPPQVGGTQEGVVNPSVKDQPGYAIAEVLLIVFLVLVILIVLLRLA